MDPFPRDFSSVASGDDFNLVAAMKVFDYDHDLHLMMSLPSKTTFVLRDSIDFGHDSYSLLKVRLVQHCPMPMVHLHERSHVLYHDVPTWDSLFELVDFCCGLGGVSHGGHAIGFQTKVAV